MIHRARPLLLAFALAGVLGAAPQDRALALAVASFEDVWQTINDTFYDPKFGGVDWAGVRRELLPRAQAARTVEDVRLVIREMIDRLGHSHFELLSDSNALPGAGSIPIDIRVMASDVVITRVPRDGPAVASSYGNQELLFNEILTADDIVRIIDTVTSADLHRVANDLFVDSRLNLAIVGNYRSEHRFRSLLSVA